MRFVHDYLGNNYNKGTDAPEPRVLALGLPRCATSSLQAALEILGYGPCMHMALVQPNPDRQKLVTAAVLEQDREKRHALLRELLHGFGATADFPCIAFADDLMDMYPDAPIILNQRSSAEAWHKSFSEGLLFFNSYLFRTTTLLVPADRQMKAMQHATDDLFRRRWGYTFHNKELYHCHNDWVRTEAAKRGREVLEFQAEQGWEPICRCLGKPVPNVPYPRINDQRQMRMVKRFVLARGLAYWLAFAGAIWAGVRFGPTILGLSRPAILSSISLAKP